ncbi:lysozyme 1-like [Saccostrea echinata]|uniref:lysozyme 1-like n=1 Tax=Saccostrea echinata TaxID=191078 RepID=UPI002A83FDE4|nr:lysozyme 1-like [Saccostrea echinata]
MFLLVILLVNNLGLLTVEGGDSSCWSLNGRCQYTSEKCFLYKPGYCAGPTNRQCCVWGADLQCLMRRGTCQNNSNYCRGGYLPGLCGGDLSRQCCVFPVIS